MGLIRFCVYQVLLFSLLIGVNFVADHYVSKPFTAVDFFAIVLVIPVLLILFSVGSRVYDRYQHVPLYLKVVLSILSVILAILFTSFLSQLFF